MEKNKIYWGIVIILILLIIGLGIFLYTQNNSYQFSLKGEKEIMLFNSEGYIEPGYILMDNENNDISNEVEVKNNINIGVQGEYEVKYYVRGKEVAVRKIIIKNINFYLNGEEEVTIDINEGNEYVESGFVATDGNNQNYENDVLVEGNVDSNKEGVYEIKYTLQIDNYSKTLIRRVNVVNYIKDIVIEPQEITMEVNDTKNLNIIITPSNATNTDYIWNIGNENIVSVINGEVKAISEGETEIEVITTNNKRASVLVKVNKKNDLITYTEVKGYVTGKEIKANVKTLSNIEPIITYYSDSACTKKTNTPIGIGTYYIKAETPGNDVYNRVELKCSKAVVITKIPVTLRVGTLNMGGFFCGTGGLGCKGASINNFGNMFKNAKVDILGTQEAEPSSKTTSAGKIAGLTNTFFRSPASTIGILSKYTFKSKTSQKLTSCMEARELQKVVVNINGVNISIYNTHFSYQSKCHNVHYEYTANVIKNDPNPTIIMADFNTTPISYYNKYFKPIGFEIAAYDNNWHNAGGTSYCDSVYVNSKGHIDIVKSESILAYGVVSDHNFVVATLNIY